MTSAGCVRESADLGERRQEGVGDVERRVAEVCRAASCRRHAAPCCRPVAAGRGHEEALHPQRMRAADSDPWPSHFGGPAAVPALAGAGPWLCVAAFRRVCLCRSWYSVVAPYSSAPGAGSVGELDGSSPRRSAARGAEGPGDHLCREPALVRPIGTPTLRSRRLDTKIGGTYDHGGLAANGFIGLWTRDGARWPQPNGAGEARSAPG